jgi:hypothetical protein
LDISVIQEQSPCCVVPSGIGQLGAKWQQGLLVNSLAVYSNVKEVDREGKVRLCRWRMVAA